MMNTITYGTKYQPYWSRVMIEPREFWIEKNDATVKHSHYCAWDERALSPQVYPADRFIHVIEKSAYDDLQSKLKIAVSLLKAFDKLEFAFDGKKYIQANAPELFIKRDDLEEFEEMVDDFLINKIGGESDE
jgi:hypothetical protein